MSYMLRYAIRYIQRKIVRRVLGLIEAALLAWGFWQIAVWGVTHRVTVFFFKGH